MNPESQTGYLFHKHRGGDVFTPLRGLFRSAVAVVFASGLFLLMPTSASASHFELSRLANQMSMVSERLAYELRYVRNYGSVRQKAERLARETRQLDEALRRNRSNSYVRSQFRDVSRRFESLEDAFLRANRQDYNNYVYDEMSVLSDLFSRLWQEFSYSRFNNNGFSNYRNNSWNYSSRSYNYWSFNSGNRLWNFSNRNDRNRNYNSRNYNNRNYSNRNSSNRTFNSRNNRNSVPRNRGSRQNDRSNPRNRAPIVSERREAIPEVFQGYQGDRRRPAAGNRQPRTENSNRNRAERVTPGSRDFDQRSPVLERQARPQNNRPRTERQSAPRAQA
ncbi:MAG: hypothetical protein HN637_12700, partial [Gammaproteobacteria bacterium]|nr:hypothetical protein [Gammaproteobacteria bacterium]